MTPGDAADEAAASAPPPRPAATIALLRPGPDGPEVLLTHRPPTMAFGPGLHVFPGGAVDPGDGDARLLARSALTPAACAAAWAGDLDAATAVAAAVAAIRELFEEAGVLLATGPADATVDAGIAAAARASGEPFAALVERLDLVLRTDDLVPLSRWVTPPLGLARRYDARFFVAALPAGIAVAHDPHEVAAHHWMTPRAALGAMAAGTIDLWPPTSTTLQQLAPARGLDDVRRHLRPIGPASPPEPAELGPDLARVRLHGAGGIPGATVNAWIVGRHRVVVVDPGDPNDAAADAILGHVAARGARIAAILLTTPAPDHAAGSTSIALRCGAQVLAAAGADRVLSGGAGHLADGELLDLADTPIRVHATPGTDPHHLAFELPAAEAVLVGDLEGGGASRTIPEPVDQAALGRSRERIAALGRAARLPAHDREER